MNIKEKRTYITENIHNVNNTDLDKIMHIIKICVEGKDEYYNILYNILYDKLGISENHFGWLYNILVKHGKVQALISYFTDKNRKPLKFQDYFIGNFGQLYIYDIILTHIPDLTKELLIDIGMFEISKGGIAIGKNEILYQMFFDDVTGVSTQKNGDLTVTFKIDEYNSDTYTVEMKADSGRLDCYGLNGFIVLKTCIENNFEIQLEDCLLADNRRNLVPCYYKDQIKDKDHRLSLTNQKHFREFINIQLKERSNTMYLLIKSYFEQFNVNGLDRYLNLVNILICNKFLKDKQEFDKETFEKFILTIYIFLMFAKENMHIFNITETTTGKCVYITCPNINWKNIETIPEEKIEELLNNIFKFVDTDLFKIGYFVSYDKKSAAPSINFK